MSSNIVNMNGRLPRSKIAVTIVFEEGDCAELMRGVCLSGGISLENLLLRWVAKGLAFDVRKPESEGEAIVRNFVKAHRS